MKFNTTLLIAAVGAATGLSLHAQATRTWTSTSSTAWLTPANWTGDLWAGEAPLANPTGEGGATDIMTTATANSLSNIGINMNTLAAAGGVGLILGGIDFNKTNTTTLQIGNSSTSANGIIQMNGATINSVPKTLVRVAGSANLTIANVNSGSGTQTMGLRLGITDGIFDVDTGRTLTISSSISETGASSGFTKTGAGTLSLGGANLYTGTTTVNAGTLRFATQASLYNNNSASWTAANINVKGGATLAVSVDSLGTAGFTSSSIDTLLTNISVANTATEGLQSGALIAIDTGTATGATFTQGNAIADSTGSGAFHGAIGLTKLSAGTLVLDKANTYSGFTSISAGTVNIQHASALGAATTGTTVASAAQLQLQGGHSYAAEPLTLGTTTSNSIVLRSISGNNVWTGSIAASGGGTSHLNRISSDADLLTLQGDLTGAVAARFVFQGAGNTTVTGKITGIAGVVGGSVGAGPAVIRTLSNDANDYTGTTNVSGGVLAFTSINNVGATSSALGAPALAEATIGMGSTTTSGTLRYIGTPAGGHTSNRVFNLAGSTGGGTIEANGTGLLALTGGVTGAGGGAKSLTLAGTNTGENSIAGISEASTSSAVSVIKSGDGKWVMTGVNTYTGATTVSAGTLLVNGSLGSTATVTVSDNATIGGTGLIAGTLSFGGNSLFNVDPAVFGETPDYLATGGISFANSGFGIDNLTGISDWDMIADGAYTLISGTLDSTNLGNFGLANAAPVGTPALGRKAYFENGSLKLVVVPEPGTLLLGSLGLLTLLRRRR